MTTPLKLQFSDLVFRPITARVLYVAYNCRSNLAYWLVLDCGHVLQHTDHRCPRYKAVCPTCTRARLAKHPHP